MGATGEEAIRAKHISFWDCSGYSTLCCKTEGFSSRVNINTECFWIEYGEIKISKGQLMCPEDRTCTAILSLSVSVSGLTSKLEKQVLQIQKSSKMTAKCRDGVAKLVWLFYIFGALNENSMIFQPSPISWSLGRAWVEKTPSFSFNNSLQTFTVASIKFVIEF